MREKKWIWIGMTLLVAALTATVIGVNSWYHSGNVRVMGSKLRVDFSGVGYIIEQETGEVTGQAPLRVHGETDSVDQEIFVGNLEILGYINEADGTLTSTKGVLKGKNGYWEIRHLDNCQHIEENEDGSSKVVNHSCKYSYIYYVHPDKQDFLVVRVKDKYEMYPVYVVLADSEEEALQIYTEFKGDKF